MKNIIFSSILFIVSYFMIGCIDDKSKDFQFNMPNVIIGSDDNINFPVKKKKHTLRQSNGLIPIQQTMIFCGPITDGKNCLPKKR